MKAFLSINYQDLRFVKKKNYQYIVLEQKPSVLFTRSAVFWSSALPEVTIALLRVQYLSPNRASWSSARLDVLQTNLHS